MSKLSGIRDIDREILSKIDDKELIKVCSIDKYTWNIVCDDAFLRRRMLSKYPEIEKYKKEGESWKQFFLRSRYYIALLKEKFDYEYEYGNFQTQLEIFEENKENETSIYEASILVQSSVLGELSLVEYTLKREFDHIEFIYSLFGAYRNGHNHILDRLLEEDFNYNEVLLRASCSSLTLVKRLVEMGWDVNYSDEFGDTPLNGAVRCGEFEIVKFLVENGAEINEFYIDMARSYKFYQILNYLIENR